MPLGIQADGAVSWVSDLRSRACEPRSWNAGNMAGAKRPLKPRDNDNGETGPSASAWAHASCSIANVAMRSG